MPKNYTLPRYKKQASCVEFCILRWIMGIVYAIIGYFALLVFGVIIFFTTIVNCFTVICTQETWEPHYNFITRVAYWQAHLAMYLSAATYDNPSFCP